MRISTGDKVYVKSTEYIGEVTAVYPDLDIVIVNNGIDSRKERISDVVLMNDLPDSPDVLESKKRHFGFKKRKR